MPDEEITLKQAAKIAKIEPYSIHGAPGKIHDLPESKRPANQPGAEATASLDTMLAASRHGKVVR